jgi:hypothetical protein
MVRTPVIVLSNECQPSSEQTEAIDGILELGIPKKPVPILGPLLMGMLAAAKFLGVSRVTLWRMIKAECCQKLKFCPALFGYVAPIWRPSPPDKGKSQRDSIWSSIFERIKFLILWTETQSGERNKMAELIQAAFMQNPLVPLLVFVRQYFSMLPNITQKATKGINRIKHNKNGHKTCVLWP